MTSDAPEPTLDDLRKRRFAVFWWHPYEAGFQIHGFFASEGEAMAAVESEIKPQHLMWDIFDLWTVEP